MEGKILCLDANVEGWQVVHCRVLAMCTTWVEGEHVRYDPDTRELLGNWSERKRWCVCSMLVKAVSWLHTCGVVHRDLKEGNYMIQQVGPEDWTVILLDLAGVYVDVVTVSRMLGGCIEDEWQDILRKYLHRTDVPKQVGCVGGGGTPRAGNILAQVIKSPTKFPGLNEHTGTSLGVVGGGGTEFRRGRAPTVKPDDPEALWRWERFDRMAVAIQVLMLVMREDVSKRMEPIAVIVKQPAAGEGVTDSEGEQGKNKKVVKKKKARGQPWSEWMENQFQRWLEDPAVQEGLPNVEKKKWRGQSHLTKGLSGDWDRRDGKGGWVDREKFVHSWDRTAECAQSLHLLMSAKKPVDNKKSCKVLDHAENKLRAAWQTAQVGKEADSVD